MNAKINFQGVSLESGSKAERLLFELLKGYNYQDLQVGYVVPQTGVTVQVDPCDVEQIRACIALEPELKKFGIKVESL